MFKSPHVMSNRCLRFAACVLLSAFSAAAFAQYDLGSLNGSVVDPSGAVVAGANVHLHDLAKGADRTVTTSADGSYNFASLPIGKYEVDITASGFGEQKATISVILGAPTSLNTKLKIGASEQVSVTGSDVAQLNTSDHEADQVVGEQQLEQLPANGRNILSLSTLGPGSQQGTDYNGTQFEGSSSFFATLGNSVILGGLPNINTSFLQDGTENVNLLTQNANILPSVESAQEVNTQLSGSPARFSRPSVVNVTTKSGSNSFHGVAYDFLQNDALDATSYFASTRPPVRYNLFGANLGGPILKNKLFFFFDYSGLRNHSSSVSSNIVPTVAERGCLDGSGICDFSGTGITLYDPATYNSATGTSKTFLAETGINGIPASRADSFSKLWVKNYPLPNIAPRADGTNYVANTQSMVNYDQFLGRVDFNLASNNTIFGTIARVTGVNTSTTIVPNLFGTSYPDRGTNASIEDTAVLSPRLVNTARVGYNRTYYFISQEGAGSQNFAALYGIHNLFANPSEYAPPAVGINNYSSFGTSYTPQGDIQNRFQYADEVSYQASKHTIVFGAEVIRTQFDGTWVNDDNGQFSFDGRFTSQYLNGVRSASSQGSALADFVLGFPANSQGAVGNSVANFREINVAGYMQDDWKLTPSLTINYGLRYDFDDPPNAQGGHSYIVDINTGLSRSGTWYTNYADFGPRIGFAYAANSRTTVRGGWGIYYTSFPYNDLQFLVLNPPNHVEQSPTFTIANPTLLENSLSPNVPLSGAAGFIFSPHSKDASVQEATFQVQRQLRENLTASIGYLGNFSRHIGIWTRPNQPTAVAPGDTSGLLTVAPHPAIGNVIGWEETQATNYNALLANVTGSLHNAQVIASYTYSKAMDLIDGDGNVYEVYSHPEYNYAPAGFDRTHQFTLAGTYQLPIGPHQRFLASGNVFSREALGGWQFGEVYRLASGEPVSIYANNNTDNSGAPMYANRVCNPSAGFTRSRSEWFNTSCFVQPATGTYGQGGRNAVRSPREDQIDLSVTKAFNIYREHQLQFRGEAFNVFNHPQFLLSTSNLTSTSNGVLNQALAPRVLQLGLRYSF